MVHVGTVKSFSKNDLIRKKLGGGCIVNKSPVFSRDGSVIFVGERCSIHIYSTVTGEFIRTYDLSENYIVNWTTLTTKPEILLICTNKGELICWDWKQGVETEYTQLKFYHDANIEQLEFLSFKTTETVEVLATWTNTNNNYLKASIFNQNNKDFVNVKIDFKNKFHAISTGVDSKIYALVQDNKVYIGDSNMSRKTRHLISEDRYFTSVCCHPYEECIATGDNTGRVLLWRNIFNKRPLQATYHWHTLPVACITFSLEGTHMYTAGDECVLVKWDVDAPQHKNFLPRVQAPIKHVTVSYDNLLVAFSMANNAVHITDSQRNLKVILNNMSWGVVNSPNGNCFSAGLHYDTRSESIIMNSHIGHIQFYNLFFNKLLYNLDITGHNQLTQEQTDNIVNIDVVKIAISTFGMWLATVEERCDLDSYFECRLKFWNFDTNDQKWVLNTCVSLPHENGVIDIKYKPSQARSSELTNATCISIGNDKKFKIWNLIDNSSIYGKATTWKSIATGYYLNRQPSCIDFSYDGSLVAIGFTSTLTVWIPDTCELKCALVHTPYASETIQQITFGNCEDCHLIVAVTSERICVWNLLSLALLWSVPIRVNLLCKDSRSAHIAVFTETNKLFVFTPQYSYPIYVHENVCDPNCKVLQAIFIPQKIVKSKSTWQQYSQLYFIDSKQELLTFEEKSSNEDNKYLESIVSSKTYNPFSSLKALTTVAEINKFNNLQISRSELPGALNVKEIIQVPSHTCAPMRYMCGPVLKSLLISNKSVEEKMDIDINF